MRLALLSDIHANLRAFEACLAHAAQAGATHHALLGDLVGYGAEPAEVVDRARALAAAGAIVLQGNHDLAALHPPAIVHTLQDRTAAWTHGRLDACARGFLAELPLVARLPSLLLVHASAHEPQAWHYVDHVQQAELALQAAGPEVSHVFVGHVHRQGLFYRGAGGALMHFEPAAGVPVPLPVHRRWLGTVGSVGQPRDGRTEAMYALWDATRRAVVFHRVPYDHLAAAAAVRAAGQPEYFARRLEEGR
jgi:predicted phosphodiesterase